MYCAILTKSSYHNGWRSVKCLYFALCKSKRAKKQYCHIVLPDSLGLALKSQQKYLTFFPYILFLDFFVVIASKLKSHTVLAHHFWLHRGCTEIANCTEVFQMFSRGFPEVFQRFPEVFQRFPEVFRRFSRGFPKVFQRFSGGFPGMA